MLYINLSPGKQKLFLEKVKKMTQYRWQQIAIKLGVNKSMIFFYLNEHSKLPLPHYERLCKLAKLTVKKEKTIKINNKPRKIKIPSLTNKFAEFLGALAGDGHMNDITYEISITLNAQTDKDYLKHTKKLIKSLFSTNSQSFTQEIYNKTKCYIYSKKLVNYLNKTYNIPIGKKK